MKLDLRRQVLIQGFIVKQLIVSLSSKGSTFFRFIWVGRITVVLSSIFLKKDWLHLTQYLAVFYLLPLVLKFQKCQRRIRVSCVVQHHLAQHTPHSCGVYHIWFLSNQIPVQLYLILDLKDKVWLVYRAFKHRSRRGCSFSKATDQYLLLKDNTIQYFRSHHPQNEKNRRLYVSAPSKKAIFER